jgi:beta-lactamase superfamily II metal-dependent hydrolase
VYPADTWKRELRVRPIRYDRRGRRPRRRIGIESINCEESAAMADIRYVKETTVPFFSKATGKETRGELLWGDRVRVLDASEPRLKVKARGRTGFVSKSAVGKKSLLEFYFIDVGQGDGVLIRTPDGPAGADGRHILIDGGWPRQSQPTGKNAIDFVDWKFHADYERDAIELDAVICSHNDQDHYGGLWDLFNTSAAARAELDCQDVRVEAIYHAGLSWWKQGGERTLGPSVGTPQGAMFTRLLGDRAEVEAGLATGASPALQGEWASFLRQAVKCTTRAGGATPIERLSHLTGSLPGFADPGGVDVKVLGPVEFAVGGKPAIRKLAGDDSQNTNGNSVLLRVDYGDVRVLLTGDLNENSQRALLVDYAGREEVFECDVAKGCHHGSGDVSARFLERVKPTVTIISSGDSEGHDHPRPEVLAASGITGDVPDPLPDRLASPLIYITELARSVALGTPTALEFTDPTGTAHLITGEGFKKVKVTYKVVLAGDRNPRTVTTTLQRAGKAVPRQIVDFTTFGLINVRTDGEKIVIAARNEADGSWNVKEVRGRF